MNKFKIFQQSKMKISAGKDRRSIEIGNTAIESGFLKLLPGSSLAIFLYLITQLENNNYVLTNSTIITNNLSYDIEQVKEGLEYLQKQEIINIDKKREGDYTYRIYLNLDQLDLENESENYSPENSTTENITELKKEQKNKIKIRDQVISKKKVSKEELKDALTSFLPQGQNPILVRNGIEQWLNDFESKQIKELVRRVNKWINNHQDSADKAFYYLQGIIDDWYEKEIFTYQKLKHFDQLYREARELAATYGLKKWHNLNSTQMNIFKKWISNDNALSLNVAKFAIKEAIKRKKDGQPSLKYIEDNFIIPWKKVGIRNIRQAKKYMAKNQSKSNYSKSNKKQKTGKNKNWNEFSWEFAEFKES